MRVLLDTHALYWYIEGDAQLSATAHTLIRDSSNDENPPLKKGGQRGFTGFDPAA